MNTGDVIKLLRQRNNMTQDELASRLCVNKSSIQKYENGMVQNLKLQTIRQLCNIFQVPPGFFIFPHYSLFNSKNHRDVVRQHAKFLLLTYARLSKEGKNRLFLCLEDIIQIEKYTNQDSEIHRTEIQILKELLEYYDKLDI